MKYNFLSVILSSIFIRIFSQNICKYGDSCICQKCGYDDDFSNCNYANLFCTNTNSDIKFMNDYESKYINPFITHSGKDVLFEFS